MSREKLIFGKHDRGHHDGRRANIRREQESFNQWKAIWPELVQAVREGKLEDESDFLPQRDTQRYIDIQK